MGHMTHTSVRFVLISWSSASNNSFTLSACFILCTEEGKQNKSQQNDFLIQRLQRGMTRLFAPNPLSTPLSPFVPMAHVCLFGSCALEVGLSLSMSTFSTAAFILTSLSIECCVLTKSRGDKSTDHKLCTCKLNRDN